MRWKLKRLINLGAVQFKELKLKSVGILKNLNSGALELQALKLKCV